MRLLQVDAFADGPFGGNPAAVCLLEEPRPEAWMAAVAREMNLSETAFVHLHRAGEAEGLPLRWFTPALEVDLCGHATLAAAHVLWEEGLHPRDEPLLFASRSGPLRARPADGGVELDFPASPPEAVALPPGLEQALGRAPGEVARCRDDLLVELPSVADVAALRPDVAALGRLPFRGVIVTAATRAGDEVPAGIDFVSRFFAPACGVDEDPVTGSAHCALAPWWCARLGRPRLTGWQASARGGRVGVELVGERVLLRGTAVTVLHGELVA